ncbi:hypothetical protein L1887_25244 [Cichorium endivia]|nr:hypothetical protein L1887_25244 [Cichorium endivia]
MLAVNLNSKLAFVLMTVCYQLFAQKQSHVKASMDIVDCLKISRNEGAQVRLSNCHLTKGIFERNRLYS